MTGKNETDGKKMKLIRKKIKLMKKKLKHEKKETDGKN